MKHLLPKDIIWMWRNTFEGYRDPTLIATYERLLLDRAIELARTPDSREAAIRAQGEAWDLARRREYLARNGPNPRGNRRDDFRVEYGGWTAD